MYAIVDIAGQQFKVEKDQKIFVHRIEGEEGSNVNFDQVLLIDNDKSVVVGQPVIEGAVVSAKILGHVRGDKVIVFKKKRRKGYQKSNGHRQYMSQIVIEGILEKGANVNPAAEKKETATKAAKQEATTTAAEDKKEQPATKAAAPKKAPAEKKASTAAKKSTKPAAAKKTAAAKPDENKAAAKKSATKKTDSKKNDEGAE